MKSGNLNFLEPCGPLQACNGTALPFYEHYNNVVYEHYNNVVYEHYNKVVYEHYNKVVYEH